MAISNALGEAIRTRRRDIGLSKIEFAKLSDLSHAAICQVENGAVEELSLTDVENLLEVIGLRLEVSPAQPRLRPKSKKVEALSRAVRARRPARSRKMSAKTLGYTLRTGEIPSGYETQLAIFLDTVSMTLLAEVVEQIHAEDSVPRKKVWKTIRKLAKQLRCFSPVWKARTSREANTLGYVVPVLSGKEAAKFMRTSGLWPPSSTPQ